MEFRVVGLGAERRRSRQVTHTVGFGDSATRLPCQRADGADPDRRAGPRARVRVRPVRPGRLARRDGQCIPDCPEGKAFPWTIKINGEAAHFLNANRISMLIPKPGEVEHWTYINGGGGWDHPIHLHFEEGVTIDRGRPAIPATERLARKDVWRLRPTAAGQVPGPVRRVRRRLRQPLPQHGARGLRHAPAHAAARESRLAACGHHPDTGSQPGWRTFNDAGDLARRRSEVVGHGQQRLGNRT